MTYDETVNWMFSQLPVYQLQGASAYKEDLSNTLLLCEHLDNRQRKVKCIHVAGTNGKGSTSHMLASILQEAGYKTGLYTSPHLKDFRERIRIDGKMIAQSDVVDFIGSNKQFLEKNTLSFFEMTVGLAFDYFAKQQVDIAIIEVGLGGRLDATNVIIPEVAVITNIGIDHVQFLGTTLEAIAGEKAGIIKQNIPVVIGEYTNVTRKVFENHARMKHAPIYFAADLVAETFPSDLIGAYQLANIKTVQQTIEVLCQHSDFKVSDNHLKSGLLNVVANTNLMGRWQKLQDNPLIICDTGHNEHGLRRVMEQLAHQKYKQLHIVLGVVNDKDLSQILPLFPIDAHYYFCKPAIARGLDAQLLKAEAGRYSLEGKSYSSVAEAFAAARHSAHFDDLIFIGGSNFVVAEVL